MKASDSDQMKRQRVFSILDELKENGERINADKVARIGKMGKQTILPYYNEWRYLGSLSEAQELDLPDDLIRELKRGIARWKHQLSEEQRAFEEAANQEIDGVKERLSQLSEKNHQLSQSNDGLQNQVQQLTSDLDVTKLALHQGAQRLKELESLLQSEQKQNERLVAETREQKAFHLQAINTLERQMDQRSQEQLNHWLSVVDDERRLKQGLEKKIDKLGEELQGLKKTNLELQSRLDSQSKAYIQVCGERDSLSSDRDKAEAVVQLANQLMVVLDCGQSDLLGVVRHLQTESRELQTVQQQYRAIKSENEKLENRLSETDKQVKQINNLQLELERVRGAAEAFEKSLPRHPDSNEVKQ